MKADKSTFYSFEMSYEETQTVLDLYVRQKLEAIHGISLDGYKLEDYDAAGGKDKGAYLMYLREQNIVGGK